MIVAVYSRGQIILNSSGCRDGTRQMQMAQNNCMCKSDLAHYSRWLMQTAYIKCQPYKALAVSSASRIKR
eukprot:2387859-Pleurochrysis_carterae.AAC.10